MVVDSNAICKINIYSLHNAQGYIKFTHSDQTIPFSVQRGHCFTLSLTYGQILSSFQKQIASKNNLSIFIHSDSAISVSAIDRLPYSMDATSILPIESLDTAYFLFRQSGQYHISVPQRKHDEYVAIAIENNTILSIDRQTLCSIDKGETYYFSISDTASYKRRFIHSNHPFALFDVNAATNIPRRGSSDKSFEQYHPLKTGGNQFFIPVTYMGREFVQVIAIENNTNISQWGGTLRTDINGVNKLNGLKAGEWVWIEIFHENNGCLISSDKPVLVCSFMTTYGYYLQSKYGDPSMVWIPTITQRTQHSFVKPFDISQTDPIHHAIIVTSTLGKNNCTICVNNGITRPLSGGTWHDHPSGWSYYDMPLHKDSTYLFSNNNFGLHVYSYGLLEAESYYLSTSVQYKNMKLSFTANDTSYRKLSELFFCEQEITFHAKVADSLSNQFNHIRWYIDSVEEISARDQLSWKKYFTQGTYQIRLEVTYEDGFTTQFVESTLHITSLEADITTTPEYCKQADGCLYIHPKSDSPSTLTYYIEGKPYTDSVICGLASGYYTLTVQDAYCNLSQQVFIDSVQGPVADFQHTPSTVNIGMILSFTDASHAYGGAISQWIWDMGDGTTLPIQNPQYIYRSVNDYTVTLTVTDENLCSDTVSKTVHVVDNIAFPNVFAPKSEAEGNKRFYPLEENGYYASFEMYIYNRWGNVVWRQKCEGGNCPDYGDEDFWWDGNNNHGKPVSAGVYFWVVKATLDHKYPPPLLLNGSVTVIR